MAKINTFRDLMIWQKAMALVTKVYKFSTNFPNSETFGLSSQLKRSAISIPCNIAEGFGRKSKLEFNRFLNIAESSIFELQTQLEIALNLEYFQKSEFENIYSDSRELERMISSFIKKNKEFI